MKQDKCFRFGNNAQYILLPKPNYPIFPDSALFPVKESQKLHFSFIFLFLDGWQYDGMVLEVMSQKNIIKLTDCYITLQIKCPECRAEHRVGYQVKKSKKEMSLDLISLCKQAIGTKDDVHK